jgi:hypothetical protein
LRRSDEDHQVLAGRAVLAGKGVLAGEVGARAAAAPARNSHHARSLQVIHLGGRGELGREFIRV